jgi:hypothetical protein
LQQAGTIRGGRLETFIEALPPIVLTTVIIRFPFPDRNIRDALRSINRTVTSMGIEATIMYVGREHSSFPSKSRMDRLVCAPEPMMESMEKTVFSDAVTPVMPLTPMTILEAGATVIWDPMGAIIPVNTSLNSWRVLTITALPERSNTWEQGRSIVSLPHEVKRRKPRSPVLATMFNKLFIECFL